MTINNLNGNPFLGKTGTVPRPRMDDPSVIHSGPEDLARHQQAWDAADAFRVEAERARDARLLKIQTDRQDAEAAAIERRKEARAELEATLKGRFMSNPAATEDAWERQKDAIVDQHIAADGDQVMQRLRQSGDYAAL